MTFQSDEARPTRVDLSGQLESVRDQGTRPTCLAFAASAAHEATLGLGEYLSVEALYAAAKSRDSADTAGTTIDSISAALTFDGQCLESDWPYGDSSLLNPGAEFYRAESRRESTDVLSFTLQSLAAGRVVVLTLTLTEAWFMPDPDGLVQPPSPDDAEFGAHAVAATGYDDRERFVVVRNSWGSNWGEGGYGKVLYDSIPSCVWEAFAVTQVPGVTAK